jgi:hypothetical protein
MEFILVFFSSSYLETVTSYDQITDDLESK